MSSFITLCRNVFLAKIPFYLLTIILAFSLLAFYYLSPSKEVAAASDVKKNTQNAGCMSMNILRLKDYELIKPVLLADINQESNDLEETKGAILDVIHQQEQYGNIATASIYLRKFNDGSWCTINGDEQYIPGSLMKIPILITFLKQAETDPNVLDKLILFPGHAQDLPYQNIIGDSLVRGNKYKIRELLTRMIVNSDNDAVTLLQNNINIAIFKKFFTDLNLPEPPDERRDYLINVADCAKIFRVLYNSTYLNHDMSEYALYLLTQTRFNKGMKREIPQTIKVADKFGESGITGGDVQLHEGGIFYVNNSPYLLIVMTKGRDFDKMSEAISSISKVVYNKFSATAAVN